MHIPKVYTPVVAYTVFRNDPKQAVRRYPSVRSPAHVTVPASLRQGFSAGPQITLSRACHVDCTRWLVKAGQSWDNRYDAHDAVSQQRTELRASGEVVSCRSETETADGATVSQYGCLGMLQETHSRCTTLCKSMSKTVCNFHVRIQFSNKTASVIAAVVTKIAGEDHTTVQKR